MDKSITLRVGLDVHKDSIDIATAELGRDGEVRHMGSIGGDLVALNKALRKLMSKGHRLHVVYEAGPYGFVIWRHLNTLGTACDVVAPSSIPKRSGERIKTDRRDAMNLARLDRSGDLTVVRVPGAADEAVRDLVRAREDSVRECRSARHRLKALLLRSGIAYAGKSSWTQAHLRWLATLKMEHAAQQIAFQEYDAAGTLFRNSAHWPWDADLHPSADYSLGQVATSMLHGTDLVGMMRMRLKAQPARGVAHMSAIFTAS